MEESIEYNKNKGATFEKCLFGIFIIFCFFPYVNILRIPTDAQPNALVVAIFIFIIGIRKYKYQKEIFIISLLMITAYIMGSVYGAQFDFGFFRSLLGYLSLFFITIVSYLSFKLGYTVSWRWFKIFVYTNILVSISQLVLRINVFEFLFFRVGTSESRGVTGLTPEPTFNATIAIFCASIYLLNYYDKKRNYILILIFIWIILLAQSSTIVLMTVPVITIYLIFKQFRKVFFPVLILFVIMYASFSKKDGDAESSRLVSVMNVVFSNPSTLIILDPSVNARISHIVIPTYISIMDYVLPHGSNMNELNKQIPSITQTTFPDFFYFDDTSQGIERIMSGWSMMFYEVGFFAFFFFFYMLYLTFFKLDKFGMEFLGSLIFIVIVFTAVTVNTSIIPYIFGNIIFRASLNLSKQDD